MPLLDSTVSLSGLGGPVVRYHPRRGKTDRPTDTGCTVPTSQTSGIAVISGVDHYGTGGHVPQYLEWGTLSRIPPYF